MSDLDQVFTGRGLHGLSHWSRADHGQVSRDHGRRRGSDLVVKILIFTLTTTIIVKQGHKQNTDNANVKEGEDPPSSVVVPGNALVVDPQLPFRPKRQNILLHFHFHFYFSPSLFQAPVQAKKTKYFPGDTLFVFVLTNHILFGSGEAL